MAKRPLILAISFVAFAAGVPIGAEIPSSQPLLGRAVRLANGVALTATLEPARDSLIPVDNNTDTRLLGPVLTLSITNTGKTAVSQSFTSLVDGTGSVQIHYEPLEGGKTQIETGAHDRMGGNAGYQSPLRGGGIGVASSGECVDSDPVALYDDRNNRIGISTQICTKPGETDRVRFALNRPNRTSNATVVVECAGCPAEGLRFPAGEHKR